MSHLQTSIIGQNLDHYRIERKLGEGGMGAVYKAHDSRLDRAVAIKVLLPDKVSDPVRRQRFVLEAKAASALKHPNIVTIHDIRSDQGVDFIVMECIDGETLDRVISRKGMNTAAAVNYAVQMADALAKAHAAGILHRDLKPSNVMIDEDGRVKILDFGLAKLLDPIDFSSEASTLTAAPLTHVGVPLGTPSYMSPEQAQSHELDSRSDIFSFGSLLYEMVLGRRPFTGDSALTVMSRIVNEEPVPPRDISPALPVDLEKLILRCLRKDPARRYQTMTDLKLALEDMQVRPTSRARVSFKAVPGWAWILLLILIVIAAVFTWQTRQPIPLEPMRAVALTTLTGEENYPSLSPDGNQVVFTWTGVRNENPDIYVQVIGTGSPMQRTADPRAEHNPTWSPNGQWIAFLRSQQPPPDSSSPAGPSELFVISPLNGPARKVADVLVRTVIGKPKFLDWCPDSTCLVVTDSAGDDRPDALVVVSLETGEKRRLTNPSASLLGDSNPAVSPDGQSLVFRRARAAGAGELYWLRLGKQLTPIGEPKRLTLPALDAAYPAWFADSKEIMFSAQQNLWRHTVTGEKPDEVAPTQLPFVGDDGLMPDISSQPGSPSRMVYLRSFDDSNIWSLEMPIAGARSSIRQVRLLSSTKVDINPQFSPDDQNIAFSSSRSGRSQLWRSDRTGGNLVQLTSLASPLAGTIAAVPQWSPDGNFIAFQSNIDGQFEVYVIPSAGGALRNLTNHPANDHVPSFSPDGRRIYFSSNRTGDYEVWKMPVSGGEAVQVTKGGGFRSIEWTDGYIYYLNKPGNSTTLWRMPVSGGKLTKLADGVNVSAIAATDPGIYYLDGPSADVRLQFFEFRTGTSKTVAHSLGAPMPLLSASRDGRTVLFSRVDASVQDLMLVENFK